MAITLHTPISSSTSLSASGKKILQSHGFTKFVELEGEDFAHLAGLLKSENDVKALYKDMISSGIVFTLPKDFKIADIPTLSKPAVLILNDMGYQELGDLEDAFFPEIYTELGTGRGKLLLIALWAAGVKVRFQAPNWSEDRWKEFVQEMVDLGLVTWEDVAVTLCGELNPPQVGTAVANAVKHNYPPRCTMQNVWRWLYGLDGKCAVSGKRLFLEADHIRPKEFFLKEGKDVREADKLENFQLLTKRENVVKRGSHKLGGLSFAPAASVLIYILLAHRPKKYQEFVDLCRNHGLTMADIRFQEAWAFAIWLQKAGKYEVEDDSIPFIKEDEENPKLDECEPDLFSQ